MPSSFLHAYIDEAGDRGGRAAASDHFVLTAIVVDIRNRPRAAQLLAGLRSDLGRQPTHALHWRNIRSHHQRVHVAETLGKATFLTISSVVVCKRLLPHGPNLPDENAAYLYTLRFLLERLSWLSRDADAVAHYTLSHISRFKLASLRHYEQKLRTSSSAIRWTALDPRGGKMDQPNRVEGLQLADLAASAIYQAFEPDEYGNVEDRYLRALAGRLYRRGSSPITSYGLKIHPWNAATKNAYGWLENL